MHIHTYTCMYIYIHIMYVHVCIYIHIYLCMCMYIYTYVFLSVAIGSQETIFSFYQAVKSCLHSRRMHIGFLNSTNGWWKLGPFGGVWCCMPCMTRIGARWQDGLNLILHTGDTRYLLTLHYMIRLYIKLLSIYIQSKTHLLCTQTSYIYRYIHSTHYIHINI